MFNKHITPCTVVITSLLVRHKPLEAPASVNESGAPGVPSHAPPLAPRLLHSHSHVAIGQSTGYEAWPPVGWHHSFGMNISLPRVPLHCDVAWAVGIYTIIQTLLTDWQSLCTALTAGKCLPLGQCMGLWKSLSGSSSPVLILLFLIVIHLMPIVNVMAITKAMLLECLLRVYWIVSFILYTPVQK